MERSTILPIVLAVAAVAAVCAPVLAQTERNIPETELKARPVRQGALPPMPFSPGGETPGAAFIQFRSFDSMTEKDRNLAADAEAAIAERAGFAGLEFNEGKWSYQQIVCPALPNHLLLQFTRNNGKGDVSVFSASIPRSGEGHVRIIPIVRRGYSLFSPAPVNALTISAFNHIRAEEPAPTTADWLTTGLCYAALAGAHPQSGLPATRDPNLQTALRASFAALEMTEAEGFSLHFTDVAAVPQPMAWTMIFNAKGKLVKAAHTPAPRFPFRVVSSRSEAGKTWTVPAPPPVR